LVSSLKAGTNTMILRPLYIALLHEHEDVVP